jgi:hypothetical protein
MLLSSAEDLYHFKYIDTFIVRLGSILENLVFLSHLEPDM